VSKSKSTRPVCIGELIVDGQTSIGLLAELPGSEVCEKAALLQESLAQLLGSRFRPANPASFPKPKFTLSDVADWLDCSAASVQRMVELRRLHPVSDEDGELYFDRAEIQSLKRISINQKVAKIISRN
jgi:hypothetical protein